VSDSARSKVVLVTGGGTGIGRATAYAHAALGDEVIITGRRSSVLDRAAVGRRGLHPITSDVTGAADVDRLFAEIGDRFGRVDVLVNNAAVAGHGALADVSDDAVSSIVATNLVAPIRVTRAALPLLAASKGVVVNISTAVGQRAWPGSAVYAATKSALESLTRSWAVELAPSGIRVVGVAPGAIDTAIGVHNGLTPEQETALRAWQVRRTPLGRLGNPEDVAHAVVALTSDAARFVTGAILAVDGGAVVARRGRVGCGSGTWPARPAPHRARSGCTSRRGSSPRSGRRTGTARSWRRP
jgi:NAD(P)-dependent dehydrogenase (short-subunit alcohol dehydrogenase family)